MNTNPKTKKNIKKSNTDKVEIPVFVHDYIKESLIGWQLVTHEEFNSLIMKNQIDSSEKQPYIIADINCDKIPDFTGIMKDTAKNIVLFQIRSIQEYYIGSELEPAEKYKSIDFGLRYIDTTIIYNDKDATTRRFDCGAIESSYFNKAAKTIFYIDNKGVQYVMTLDK